MKLNGDNSSQLVPPTSRVDSYQKGDTKHQKGPLAPSRESRFAFREEVGMEEVNRQSRNSRGFLPCLFAGRLTL